MYRILIVEDDLVIAKTLCVHLQKWNLEARYVREFDDILSQFVAYAPHLVLLDLSLPFYNGFTWCTKIRELSKAPIIFLSSASDELNIVTAMHMGADDFIAKPFDLNVLTAKVQALLRRSYAFRDQMEVLAYQGILLDLADMSVRAGDIRVELTKNEVKILQLLFEHAGRAVPRDTIMTRLWQNDSFVDKNTLSVNIARLRKKLEQAGIPALITTKKGGGYQLGEPPVTGA